MPPLHNPIDVSLLPHPLALRSVIHDRSPRIPLLRPALTPTKSINPRSLASLFRRQQVTVTATTSSTATSNPDVNRIIPATYSGLGKGPTPGTVVGIVFGSVAGFLLLLWLLYTCFNGIGSFRSRSSVVEEEVITTRRRSRSPRRTSTHRSSTRRRSISSSSRSRNRTEVIEVQSRRDRTPSRRETVVIEERRQSGPPADEYVEVIEEHSRSPERRDKSERRTRVSSGYRNVDPEEFAGGSRPMRKVSSRR